jgi:hypothetical protein
MPEPTAAGPVLTDELFRLLRDYIQKLCGIYFKDTNKFLLERRIMQRIKALQFTSFEQYYYYLSYDPRSAQEKDYLFDVITTNETYFFREMKQLTAFLDEIVPEVLAVKPKLRVWSAGCSTGEEPFTLAMLMDERGWFEKGAIDIYASARRPFKRPARASTGKTVSAPPRTSTAKNISRRWPRDNSRSGTPSAPGWPSGASTSWT